MKVEAEPVAQVPGGAARIVAPYSEVTGQSAIAWASVALFNLITQVVLFHAMVGPTGSGKPTGEFGTLNAALAIIGLFLVPLGALVLTLRLPNHGAPVPALNSLRASPGIVIETSAWIWGVLCFVLLFLPWPMPSLPRFALQLLTLINVLLGLGAWVGFSLYAESGLSSRWTSLVLAGGTVRIVAAAWFTSSQPWAEAALAAWIVGGIVTLLPALRPRSVTLAERRRVIRLWADRDFRRTAAAMFSALLGVFLFTNADRIASLSWLNVRIGGTLVPSAPSQHIFDIYQATGLLARSLLWGTQPLLWLLYADRVKLKKTTPASLRFFWIYLGVLLLGVVLLVAFGRHGGMIDGLIPQAGSLAPTFAAVMVPLGLLQGLAIFSLASGRRPECHVLGVCSILYALVLGVVGRRPETMLPYMLGLSLISLMVVLFVGVVRWGRRQP